MTNNPDNRTSSRTKPSDIRQTIGQLSDITLITTIVTLINTLTATTLIIFIIANQDQ